MGTTQADMLMTETSDYRARYYDPAIGRFISEDPLGLGGGINRYAYVRNGPINLTDPQGLCPRSQCLNQELMNGNAATLMLDLFGFIPGEKVMGEVLNTAMQVGAGAVSTVNTLANGNGSVESAWSATASIGGTLLTALKPVVLQLGLSLTGFNNIYNAAQLGWDAYTTIKDYNKCMSSQP
jgi:RHS repeat-associated protein